MGVVLQSALYRSERDLERLSALGARVRLVKGAYKEPKTVAYQKKSEVDAAYTRMVQAVLTTGHFPAIATHDPAMIRFTLDFARYRKWPPTVSNFKCCTAFEEISKPHL